MIDKETIRKGMKTAEPYIALGLAGVAGVIIYAYDTKLNNTMEQFEQFSMKPQIEEYMSIEKKLDEPLTANELFDDESKQYFTNLMEKRDSLKALPSFEESREEYNSLEKEVNRLNNDAQFGMFCILSAGTIFGFLGFNSLYKRHRRKED